MLRVDTMVLRLCAWGDLFGGNVLFTDVLYRVCGAVIANVQRVKQANASFDPEILYMEVRRNSTCSLIRMTSMLITVR